MFLQRGNLNILPICLRRVTWNPD